MDTSLESSATPAPSRTSTAKRTSHDLSDSDYELLVEGVKNLGVQDNEHDSNTKVSLGLDKSPAPAGGPQSKKKKNLQSVQGDDDCSLSPIKNCVSNRKTQHRNTCRTDETPSKEQGVLRSLNVAGAKDIPRSRKGRSSKTPSLSVKKINSPGASAQNGTLSAPGASHKRSASAPGPYIKSKPTTQDTPIASTSSKNALPTQAQEVDATTYLAPPYCSSRRRSASLGAAEHTGLPAIEYPSSGDTERVPGVFPDEFINSSELGHQSHPESPKRMPDLHPDETRQCTRLEHMHPIKKNKNDLKNEILRLIRRQKSKPAAASTLKHGYIYIFKSDRFSGYVKIGSTVEAPDTRIKQWETKCKFKAIRIVDQYDTAFKFCRIVEQIVHAELYNEQRKFYCYECNMAHRLKMTDKKMATGGTGLDLRPTEHGEWFEIPESKALKVVNKWRDWVIHQQPYREDGTLLSSWVWKYEMGTKWMKGTEAEWEFWRYFGWLDSFRFTLHEFNNWLGEVFPLLQKLVNVRGSFIVLATGFYLGTAGVNLTSWLKVAIALLLYRFICFKFC